jgi:hypothetical protein
MELGGEIRPRWSWEEKFAPDEYGKQNWPQMDADEHR